MKRALTTLRRWLLAVVLTFFSVALASTLFVLPMRDAPLRALVPTLFGFAGGMLIFLLGHRFLHLYVFGHELTHWMTAKVFRRRTGHFRVGGRGGSVEVHNPNIWIVLAPYFVPIYTLLWVGLGGFLSLFLKPIPVWAMVLFCIGAGITYAFHLVLTAYALAGGQDDLRVYGRIYSLSLILFCNLALLFAVVTVTGRHWQEAPRQLVRRVQAQWSILARLAKTAIPGDDEA